MTQIIKTYTAKTRTNKKPGWKQEKADHDAWLANLKKQTLFNPASKPKMQKAVKPTNLIVKGPNIDPSRTQKPNSLGSFGVGTIPVHRPDIMYKNNPEMLERELIARERKFNVAPAYNKGPDQLVTEEELVKTLSSNRRR